MNPARLRGMSVRRKLLVLSAAPVLVTAALLLVLFIWGHEFQARADEEALAWQRHSHALRQLDWAARFYVDSVADGLVQDPSPHEAESREILEQATAEALMLAEQFSSEELADQTRLDAQLRELIEYGTRVGKDRTRLRALEARYRDTIRDAIRRRVEEESIGSARALEAAHEMTNTVWIGGFAVAVLALLGAIGASVIAIRGFGGRVAALEKAAARVAAGDLEGDVPATSSDELGRLAGSLNTMVDALRRQRSRQFGFLAAVAHDLRNPLAAMRITTETLLHPTALPDEALLRKSLARIHRQTERLGRMTNDLLDAASIEAGQLELETSECDLAAVARDVLELYTGSSPRHQLRLSTPAEPVVAACDPARIAQVLDNLVSNAIKYSPEGGPVEIDLAAGENEVLLSVADAGMGIAPGMADAIFEPFHRGVPDKSVAPGRGLGLWICRRIVVAHGGSLAVVSDPGHGARFEIHLPRQPAARPA